MPYFLNVDESDQLQKIDIDELYEKDQQNHLKQMKIFNKILNRIHNRIKITSRNKKLEKHIWFNIPEYIFGEPLYDKSECIAYIITQLEDNGFFINYMHPNTLFISWANWVPTYVRNEIKKKKGIIVDKNGNVIDKVNKEEDDANTKIISDKQEENPKKDKQFTPIDKYKPIGIYRRELFEKLEKKL